MTFYPRLWPGIFVARYNDREDAFKAGGGGASMNSPFPRDTLIHIQYIDMSERNYIEPLSCN